MGGLRHQILILEIEVFPLFSFRNWYGVNKNKDRYGQLLCGLFMRKD